MFELINSKDSAKTSFIPLILTIPIINLEF